MKNTKINEFIESDPRVTERYLRAMRSDYARDNEFFQLDAMDILAIIVFGGFASMVFGYVMAGL